MSTNQEFTGNQIDKLLNALSDKITANQYTAPVLSDTGANLTSPNADENPSKNSPSNTPINVFGNAANALTAIKKANQTLSHACDSSSYVGKAVAQVGAFAGQIVRAIRQAVIAALTALGFSPSASGLISQLKKIAQFIKDVTKFINEITKYIAKFIAYLNALKQLLAYILALPLILLHYFSDCIKLLERQLVAGYQEGLGSLVGVSSTDISAVTSAIADVTKSVGQFTSAVTTLSATTAAAAISLVTPTQIAIANTQAQAEATQAVFTAAGFSSKSTTFAKA